jgi:DNA polymerase-3 subunit delta'
MREEINNIIQNHHAILLEGDKNLAFEIRDFLKEDNDVFLIEKNEISIEDARSVKENANLKPLYGNFRFVLVSANKLGREAGESLLKILEEPPKETKIIIVTPNPKFISPTILSRMVKVKDSFRHVDEEVLSFLKKDSLARLKIVEGFLKNEDFNSVNFLDQLENAISRAYLLDYKEFRESVLDIYKSKEALQIAGTSKKQILEYIALTLPKY